MRGKSNGAALIALVAVLLSWEPQAAHADPFSAIAAGDMTSSSAVLWTQLRHGDGLLQLQGTATPLVLDVSRTADFASNVLSLSGVSTPENGNTLKLLASGLSANTQYYYRFRNGNSFSETGTFFTTPSSNQITPFKIGLSGDYDAMYRPYTVLNGFGTRANPGSVGLRYFINLGDLIYERSATGSPRLPSLDPGSSAADNQNALNSFYRKYIENVTGVNANGAMNAASGQQGTRQLLASTGVYSLLDNHEVYNAMISGGAPQNSEKENHLCGDALHLEAPAGTPCLTSASNNGPGATYINKTITQNTMAKAFYNTQATAVQIDGLPTTGYSFSNLMNGAPVIVAPNDPRSDGTPQNFFSRNWGGAARYIQLDDRSYRDARMLNTTSLIANDPNRTMLGMTQLDWFKSQLLQAQNEGVVWKVVSVSTPIDIWVDPANKLDNKSWIAGYNAERNAIMKFIEDNRISNVVFLTTDDHIARATRLTYQPAGATAGNAWSTMTNAFQLLAGPAGAQGPYENYLGYGHKDGVLTTGFGIGTTETLLNEKNPFVLSNGGAPVGLMGLPGLNNVYRDENPTAAAHPTSKDFSSATTYGYTTLAWDRFANLSVEYHGIDAYPMNVFPQTSATPRLLFGFTVDVDTTIRRGDVVTLTDADRHQFTGRDPDPLFFNSKWTNLGTLDILQTSVGAGFARYEGDGALVVGANTPLSVREQATLQGGVVIANVAEGGAAYLPKTPWTVLRADGGLTGTFAGAAFSAPLSFLTPELRYSTTDVTMTFALTPFESVARNANQRNVGAALTAGAFGAFTTSGANVLNALFHGGPDSARLVMDTVGGAGLVAAQTTAMEIGQSTSSTISDQIAFWRAGDRSEVAGVAPQASGAALAYAPSASSANPLAAMDRGAASGARAYRAWGTFLGGRAHFRARDDLGAPEAHATHYGALAGLDYQFMPNALVGFAIGGTSAKFNVGSLGASGDLTGFHAGLYAAYRSGASYVSLGETFSAFSNATTRRTPGLGFLPAESLKADFNATEFRTRIEAGHGLRFGGWEATPFVAMEFASYRADAFTERSGAGAASSLALRNNAKTTTSLPVFAGLRLAGSTTLANGWRLGLAGSLAYVHEFFPKRDFNYTLTSLPTQDFTVAGPRADANLLQIRVGAQLELTQSLTFFSSVRGEVSSGSRTYGGTAGLRYSW